MADSRPTSANGADTDDPDGAGEDAPDSTAESTEELRRQVEDTYDFEDFGPSDMARMSRDEWEAAFDAESWITGEGLLRRVDADLRNRIKQRDVFARLERVEDGLLAYSDEGYAVVHPDGSVEGRGTVLRDVKPTVALCSMDDYEIPSPPKGDLLPEPEAVPEGTGELGNWMLQAVAAAQFVVGIGLVVAWVVLPVGTIFAPVIGLLFVAFSILLFLQVANARLSDRFRSEEYRDRLRAVGIGSDERPEFLPEKYRENRRDLADDDPETRSTERPDSTDEADDSTPSA